MKRHAFVVAAAIAVLTARAALAQETSFDSHFLDSTEYFISEEAFSSGVLWVAVGRMVVGPTSTSRGQAQFLVVGGGVGLDAGRRVWTQYYWLTRPTTIEDVKLGKTVFCIDLEEDSVHRGPHDRSEALNNNWYMTIVTDVSDLFRQEVRASERRLGLSCLRVVR